MSVCVHLFLEQNSFVCICVFVRRGQREKKDREGEEEIG